MELRYNKTKLKKKAYIYMVCCEDNSIYTGITTDIGRRIREHYYKKKSGAKYTKSRKIKSLEIVWETENWSDAAKLEYQIKKLTKTKKEELICHPEQVNVKFKDIFGDIYFKPCLELTLEICLEKKENLMSRLEQQLSFLMEIDKQKEIVRQTYLADGSRKETDAEHAWHIAIMCMILSEYANEPIDTAKTIMMLLTHDLVEIDAGDTYAYDIEGNSTKQERELKAAEHIYGILPPDQGKYLRELWDEFEAMETPESKFANMLDKIQPVFLTDQAEGKSWREHNVCSEQILSRNHRTHEGSEYLWDFVKRIIQKNIDLGFIRGEDSKK